MRYYTYNLLTLLLTAYIFQGCLNAQAPSYSLYEDCNEYYDSRGFYHNDCKENKLDRRKLKKGLKILTAEVDPGDGEEQNSSRPNKFASTIDDIIEDSSDDPTLKGDTGGSNSSTPAIVERPELEFGREGQ